MDSSQLVTTLHQSSLHGGQSTSTRGWSVWVPRILLQTADLAHAAVKGRMWCVSASFSGLLLPSVLRAWLRLWHFGPTVTSQVTNTVRLWPGSVMLGLSPRVVLRKSPYCGELLHQPSRVQVASHGQGIRVSVVHRTIKHDSCVITAPVLPVPKAKAMIL